MSNKRDYSVLRWAMYGKIIAGLQVLRPCWGSLEYQPTAKSDTSPRNKADLFLLVGRLSDKDVEALR